MKTLYLFRRLLTMGDFISVTGSHQEALTMAMNEVVSVYGLKVKTWQNGENNAFPGGYEYHNNHGKCVVQILRRRIDKNQMLFEGRMVSFS